MATRKKSGDFLDVLSAPGKGKGLVQGAMPVNVGGPNPKPPAFPGVVGLGSSDRTGRAPASVAPRRPLLDEPAEDRGPRRLDLVLGGLLALLLTNIVSFTLGARAGRQATPPAAGATVATPPARTLEEQISAAQPPATAAAIERNRAEHPTAPSAPGAGPLPPELSSRAQVPVTPPPPAPAAVDPDSLVGKYVVRCITLDPDDAGKARAAEIARYIEGKGVTPCLVRTTKGRLVVEAGAFDRFKDATAAQATLKTLRLGGDAFDSAYVLQRSR